MREIRDVRKDKRGGKDGWENRGKGCKIGYELSLAMELNRSSNANEMVDAVRPTVLLLLGHSLDGGNERTRLRRHSLRSL